MTDPRLEAITRRITERSANFRQACLSRIDEKRRDGPQCGNLACSNLAHAFAASEPEDRQALKLTEATNIGIVTSYNDMLSAHQPLGAYPDIIKRAANSVGCTARWRSWPYAMG